MSKRSFFEKIFSFFYAFLGSKRIEQMRLGEVQKAQDTALEAADSKKRRTLSKARGIGAEMSCRRELPTERWRRAKRQLCLGKGAGGCELQRKARCAPFAARTRPKKKRRPCGRPTKEAIERRCRMRCNRFQTTRRCRRKTYRRTDIAFDL